MLTRKLFPSIFKKFQNLLVLNQQMESVLNVTTQMKIQDKVRDIYQISNIISQQISELQKPFIQNFFRQLPVKDQKIKSQQVKKQLNQFIFDETTFKFVLKSSYKIKKSEIKRLDINRIISQEKTKSDLDDQEQFMPFQTIIQINACPNQKIDSPSIRKSLYFHELKDLKNYVRVKPNCQTPPFVQQLNMKKLQLQALDKKNPLGVPNKMPPLFIQIYVQNKVYLKIKYYLGQVILIQVRKLQKKFNNNSSLGEYEMSKQKISGMRIPRNAQQSILKNFLQNMLSLDSQKIFNYHKMAYVGGRIQKLQLMMNIHQLMWSQVALDDKLQNN